MNALDRPALYHRDLLQWAFPNPATAVLVIVGVVLEATLLAGVPDNVYQAGFATPWLAISALVWFWLTLGTATWLLTSRCNHLRQQKCRATARCLITTLTLTAAALIVAHLLSWGLYYRTGRFANLEVLLFAIENPPQTTWLHLRPSEQTGLLVLAASAIVLLAVLPHVIRWMGRSSWAHKRPLASQRRRLSAWTVATATLLATTAWFLMDPSPQRRATQLETLKCRLNPVIALAASGLDSIIGEPIVACLDTSGLQPLGSSWRPPAATPSNRPSIIIVAIESLREDVVHLRHQGREVMPTLNRLAEGGLNWSRAYAQSTHSDYSDVCIVSSLYPLRTRNHHYYRKTDPWPRTLIYDLLQPAGYQTAIISSQNEAWGGMDQFLETPQLDLFYDAKRSGAQTYVSDRDPGLAQEVRAGTFLAGCLYDRHTMDTAIDWVGEQVAADRPYFLSMNFQASHFPYELPPACPRPFQPCQLDADVSFMHYPIEKTPNVRNAYYNALHHCDQQLGRLVTKLQQLGKLDDVILVVLGENGEAFHENNSVGHAREPVEPAVHVATVIHAPKYVTPGTEAYPLELVDLVPTLFGLMGWPTHPNFQGLDALSPHRPAVQNRLMFFHVLSPAARADAVTLAGRWKYMHSYDKNQSWLFDLAVDPTESTDVSAQNPDLVIRLRAALHQWRRQQLAYYHFPRYYSSYFPPKPPRFLEIDKRAKVALHSGEQE